MSGLRVQGLQFRAYGLRVWGLGLVGSGFGVQSIRVYGLGVQGPGLIRRVEGVGFRLGAALKGGTGRYEVRGLRA